MSPHECHMQVQGPFRPRIPLILASASPRRQALLTGLGLHFQVRPSRIAEPDPSPGQTPADYVQRMAEEKAHAVHRTKRPGLILAADTVVVAGSHILGKPASRPDALNMLSILNGQTHTVLTGCCLIPDHPHIQVRTFAVDTRVTFSHHPEPVLAAYVQTGEPMDKAGGYAIQGAGGFLVSHIQGSYSNVVGLPLTETVQALLDMQAIIPAPQTQEQDAPCPEPAP